MEKLNVRFDEATKDLIESVAKQQNETFSAVAREAMLIGLDAIKHSPAYYVDADKLKVK